MGSREQYERQLKAAFDAYPVGQSFEFRRTFTSGDVSVFCGVTGDFNPYHLDEAFARQTPFGRVIIPGLLTGSMMTHIGGLIGFLATEMSFQFLAPVYVGDTITCTLTITEKDETRRFVSGIVSFCEPGQRRGRGRPVPRLPQRAAAGALGPRRVSAAGLVAVLSTSVPERKHGAGPGRRPVLVDTGFGSDLAATEEMPRDSGIPPESLSLIVNTHYHSDHVGGNSALQRRYRVPIAAHRLEAEMINRRDPEACAAEYLDQPVEPYRVDRLLVDGDELDAGGVVLTVLHTPGHTRGHISLYAAEERLLICGDAVHRDDVGWINVFREGVDALSRALESLDRLASLNAGWACSGHGPPMDDPRSAIDAARGRYEQWLTDPEKMAWHACKRVFVYELMLWGGRPEAEVAPYLLGCGWVRDFSRQIFRFEPADFVGPLVAEMLRSKAAWWRAGRLEALAPHNAPQPGWLSGPGTPRYWSAVLEGRQYEPTREVGDAETLRDHHV